VSEATLSNLSTEQRRFEPPAELAADANLTAEAYERAAGDRVRELCARFPVYA